MSGFVKYFHLERMYKDETKGINSGTIFIQPKLDGTCSSVWMDKDGIKTGSRNRELTLDNDNQGFCRFIEENKSLYEPLFTLLPNATLFGEWLVPHQIKWYVKDAWRKFYVFDVALHKGEALEYLTPEQYQPVLDSLGIAYVPTVAKLENYTGDFSEFTDKVKFLIDPTVPNAYAEGLVIKNYGFINRYGRNTFAKIVFEQFKVEKPLKAQKEKPLLEASFVEKNVTQHLVQKELAKLRNAEEVQGKVEAIQGKLLHTVYKAAIEEELFDFIRKNKNPIIDFKALYHEVVKAVKTHASELY